MASAKSPSKYGWEAMAALCLSSVVVSGIAWNTLSVFADPVVNEWGILRTQYMVVPSIVAFGNMFISLTLFGWLEKKFGLRKQIAAGLFLMGAGAAVFALANGLVMLYIAAALWGLGLSQLGNSMRSAAVVYWFAKRQSTMISIVAGVGQGAGIIAAAVFGYLVFFTSWRPLMWFVCACLFVTMFVCWFLYRGTPQELGVQPLYTQSGAIEKAEESEESGPSLKECMKTWQWWAQFAGWVVMGIPANALMANLVLIAIDYGYVAQSALVLSVCLLSSTILSPVGGWICDKFGPKLHIVLGMAGVAVSCVVTSMPGLPLWSLFAVAILLGFGWNTCIIPPASCTVQTFGRREFAQKNTIMCAGQGLGVAIAPTLYSAFYDFGGGYASGNVVVVVCALVTIAIFLIANNKKVNLVKE